MNRLRVWFQVYQGRRVRIFVIVYSIIGAFALIVSQFFYGKAPTVRDLMPNWSGWSWVIIGIAVLWIIALENIYRDYKQKASANWIEQHKMKTGKLPPISDYLLDVVQNYTKGLPINKSIKVITPSAQFWNRLLPSQQDELLSIVSWLGEDTRDYIARMKAVSPPGQLNKIQLRWKR